MKQALILTHLVGVITAASLRMIQLQSIVTNQFVTVYWPDGAVKVDSVAYTHASTFEVHEVVGNKNQWQLRAVKNNMYFCAENGGGSTVIANRTSASGWETFDVTILSDNTVNLKTYNGFFLGIDGTGSSALIAEAEVAQSWETFNLIEVPQLRGVNLGSWLIPEHWMFSGDSDLWANSGDAQDLYTLCQNLGETEATRRLTAHRDTWFTEDDFVTMVAEGVNHIRLPMGYWDMIESPPYVFGGAEYIDKAIKWAQKYGMSVLIDLHGAPGSQNGQDHSGHAGAINWPTPENIAETVTVLGMISERWSNEPNVWGIELMNEPHWSLSWETLTEFYRNAYDEIRKYSDSVNIVLCSLYGPHDWTAGIFPEPQYRNVVLDIHLYTVWSGYTTEQQYYDEANRWATEIRSLVPYYPIIVGEMSLATSLNPYTSNARQQFADAEFNSFQENAYGYIFWSQKLQYYSEDWALQDGIPYVEDYYSGATTQNEVVA